MSDGVEIIRALLVGSGGLVNLVPATRIMAGALPQGTTLPAISITGISGTDRNILKAGSRRMVRERVQATILAGTYPSAAAVLRQVRLACLDRFPDNDEVINVTVHAEGRGPDIMNEEASITMKTQDFIVTYSELTRPEPLSMFADGAQGAVIDVSSLTSDYAP